MEQDTEEIYCQKKMIANCFEIISEVKHFLLIGKGYLCTWEGCIYIKFVHFSHSNGSLLKDTTILHSITYLYCLDYTNSTICAWFLPCVNGDWKTQRYGVGGIIVKVVQFVLLRLLPPPIKLFPLYDWTCKCPVSFSNWLNRPLASSSTCGSYWS